MTNLIRTTNLSVKTLAGETLVEPISLEINAGENLIILGETGSGKSLLIQAIMGCLPRSLIAQGEVYIAEKQQNNGEVATKWGRQLAMLPQEPCRSLDPTMPIKQQVWESFYFVAQQSKEQAWRKTTQNLTALGLASFADYYPHQLSGGMAQRAASAMATAGGANIVLADEPTKGLDEQNKKIMIQLLAQIAQQGGALLVITHDIEVAKQLGGKMMVIQQGKLQEQGDSRSLLQAPQEAYTKKLIAAAPSNWAARPKTALTADKLLEVKQLALARGKRTLFSGLDFQLRQGEILGVIGASGLGKSSLGDALCGLLKPRSGQIRWHKATKRQQVLKLYQDPPTAFAPKVKLKILLEDVIKKHQLDQNRVPYLLQQLNLSPALLERSAEQVSGGELQRIGILRALLFDPVLLFADEVTSRLDPITQQQTMGLLVNQCALSHCALVIVSHDPHLVRHYCHQVIDLADYGVARPSIY